MISTLLGFLIILLTPNKIVLKLKPKVLFTSSGDKPNLSSCDSAKVPLILSTELSSQPCDVAFCCLCLAFQSHKALLNSYSIRPCIYLV